MTNFRTLAIATALLGAVAMPALAQGSVAGSAAATAASTTVKAKPAHTSVHRIAATTETKKPVVSKSESIKIDATKADSSKSATKPAMSMTTGAPTAKPVVITETPKAPAPIAGATTGAPAAVKTN